MSVSRKRITISMREDLYDALKERNIKISTAINLLIEEFLKESS